VWSNGRPGKIGLASAVLLRGPDRLARGCRPERTLRRRLVRASLERLLSPVEERAPQHRHRGASETGDRRKERYMTITDRPGGEPGAAFELIEVSVRHYAADGPEVSGKRSHGFGADSRLEHPTIGVKHEEAFRPTIESGSPGERMIQVEPDPEDRAGNLVSPFLALREPGRARTIRQRFRSVAGSDANSDPRT
jgi:hypothetical protein